MNKKEEGLYLFTDAVVECCTMKLRDGRDAVTRELVLGQCKAENVVMTRCILVAILRNYVGYTPTTIGHLIGRTPQGVRKLLAMDDALSRTSAAYQISYAQSLLKCKDIVSALL